MSGGPRVVVVGAGMAGLAAAHRLHQARRHAFDLAVLEGSHRVGGRIQTAYLAGEQVELGATLIHGINGNPIYEIAQRSGALAVDSPREIYQNRFHEARFRAEGARLPVDPHLVSPAVAAFTSSMELVKGNGNEGPSSSADGSVGAFLQEHLCTFLSWQGSSQAADDAAAATAEQEGDSDSESGGDLDASDHDRDELPDFQAGEESSTHQIQADDGCRLRLHHGDCKKSAELHCIMWSPLQLQQSVFCSLEGRERTMSACNSLYDLDLASYKEYTEFPGRHITIGKGYASVLKELEKSLPVGTVQFGKKVQKIFWNYSYPSSLAPVVVVCEDGSVIEAEHAIVTVSLGVLKAGISNSTEQRSSRICRSVSDLRGWKASEEAQGKELFQPPLPSRKVMAISGLGFGLVNKLFLVLDPSADKSLLTEICFLHERGSERVPSWLRRAFAMFPIYRGSNVVVLWFSGEEALQMEGLSDEEILDGVAQLLASFKLLDYEDESLKPNSSNPHPEEVGDEMHGLKRRLRGMLKGVLRSSWGTDPLCQGAYSFVATGSSGNDIDILATPLPETVEGERVESGEGTGSCSPGHTTTKFPPLQLLFAGEATHRNFYSTTHGAFLSGVREADRILDHFEKISKLS